MRVDVVQAELIQTLARARAAGQPGDEPCTHQLPLRWEIQDVLVSPYGDTEPQLVECGGESTQLDYDIGRFRCCLCGEIGYYTGLWRDYFEKGIPCPGSDGVRRDMPVAKPTA